MNRDNIDESVKQDGRGNESPRVLILDDKQSDLDRIEDIIRRALHRIDPLGEPIIETTISLNTASTSLRKEKWSLVVSDLSLNAGTQGYSLLSDAVAAGFACIGVSGAGHVLEPGFVARMYNEFGSRLFRFVPKKQLEVDLPIAVQAVLTGSPRSALNSQALEISTNLPDMLDLSTFRVIADCYRYDDETRNYLRSVCDRILDALIGTSGTRENFLIWAPSGTGKTFLVQQIMRARGAAILPITLDIAQPDEKEKNKFAAIRTADLPVLCLIDEADKEGKLRLGNVFRSLDLNIDRTSNSIVFVVVGSSGRDSNDLAETIRKRPAGRDLISRIPRENWIDLPTSSLGERAIVFAARVRAASTKPIVAIHRAAMFYVLQNSHFGHNREIDHLASKAVSRSGSKNRVDFCDLFEPRAESFLEFVAAHHDSMYKLWKHDIRVTDSSPR